MHYGRQTLELRESSLRFGFAGWVWCVEGFLPQMFRCIQRDYTHLIANPCVDSKQRTVDLNNPSTFSDLMMNPFGQRASSRNYCRDTLVSLHEVPNYIKETKPHDARCDDMLKGSLMGVPNTYQVNMVGVAISDLIQGSVYRHSFPKETTSARI